MAAPGQRASTVLVVDDDPLVRMVGADMMADLGFDVLEAGGGAAALQLLAERPEVVLMVTDIRMPGMDGVELAERAMALRPELKVIFVSGYRVGHTTLPAPLVQKPFATGDLRQAVDLQLS